MTAIQDVPNIMLQDMATLFAGRFIGGGVSRNVYAYGLTDDYVLKFEYGQGWFQNTKEWLVWESVKQVRAIAEYFAPCSHISDLGRWLIQRRTQPVTIVELRKRMPKVPAIFTDLKVRNWGRIGERIVCHDYGTCLVMENGFTTRLKRANWYE